jgi:hypothetical protein
MGVQEGAAAVDPLIAESLAIFCFNTMKSLTGTEEFAQMTHNATPAEADEATVRALTRLFTAEELPDGVVSAEIAAVKPTYPKLTPRVDAQHTSSDEMATGDYYFSDDHPQHLEQCTYHQAYEALRHQVPVEGRQMFKRLHAEGATPYQAYLKVMEWREEQQGLECGDAEPRAEKPPSRITDAVARQQVQNAPTFVQQAYGKAVRNGSTPAEGLAIALELWRQSQSEAG